MFPHLVLALAVVWLTFTRPSQADEKIAQIEPVFPLKISANGRYLVDQNDTPFLLVGDSPQSLIGNVTLADAAQYMKNRAGYGINALWVNLLCNSGTACQSDGQTVEGLAPFGIPGDMSSPDQRYFDHAKAIIRLAAEYHIVVLLDPIETNGWLEVLRSNGSEVGFSYGAYLAKTFTDCPNIIWLHGNDFQSWQSRSDDALVQSVADGIRSQDHVHINTVELNYATSGSLDDPTWRPLIDLDAAYTYYATYAQVLVEYNRSHAMPVFLVEANYEFERNPGTDGGAPPNLRHQDYWSVLSGATGVLYGSAYTWQFLPDWKQKLDTQGVRELQIMKQLLDGYDWKALVPDQHHKALVSGFGVYSAKGSVATDTYVSAARTPDGRLLLAYLPASRPVVVDMAEFKGAMLARWYDPTSGAWRSESSGTLPRAGQVTLTPPGKNASGDEDWVLVISDVAAVRRATN